MKLNGNDSSNKLVNLIKSALKGKSDNTHNHDSVYSKTDHKHSKLYFDDDSYIEVTDRAFKFYVNGSLQFKMEKSSNGILYFNPPVNHSGYIGWSDHAFDHIFVDAITTETDYLNINIGKSKNGNLYINNRSIINHYYPTQCQCLSFITGEKILAFMVNIDGDVTGGTYYQWIDYLGNPTSSTTNHIKITLPYSFTTSDYIVSFCVDFDRNNCYIGHLSITNKTTNSFIMHLANYSGNNGGGTEVDLKSACSTENFRHIEFICIGK